MEKNSINFFFTIFIFFSLAFFPELVQAQEEISVVILRETQQTDLNKIFGNIFSDIEKSFNIVMKSTIIEVDRDNTDTSLKKFCNEISNGFSLVVDVTWSAPWPDMMNEIRSKNAPYVRLDVSIRPFVRALLRFIEHTDTHDLAMVLRNEKEQYEGIYELLNQYSIRSITYPGLSESISERILDLRPVPNNYGMVSGTEDMNVLFNKAIKHGILEHPNRWRFVYTDFVDRSDALRRAQMLYDSKSILPSKEMCCVFVGANDNCNCNLNTNIPEIFLTNSLNQMFTLLQKNQFPKHKVQCQSNANTTDALMEETDIKMSKFEEQIQSEILTNTKLIQSVKNTSHELEYYIHLNVIGRFGGESKLANNESPAIVELAVIDNSGISVQRNTTIEAPRRFFRIGIAPAIPWTMEKIDPKTGRQMVDEKGKPLWEGYCIDFAAKLAEVMNFDYELILPKVGTIGDRVPGKNHTWDGLVGELVIGDIDIAVSAMKMTAEREEVIDFVAPYYEQTGILIVIRKPVRQTSLFKFMTVLRVEVWLSIVGAIISTAIMLWLLDKYSPYSAKNNSEAYPYECRDFTFKESLWFAMTSFTPQGGGEAPKALSSRVLVAAYWLFVVLMLATFTANLAAFLTVERMQTPVQSLEQLARQSRINYTVVEGSDTHKFFINMKFAEDTLYRMWKELTLNSSADQTQYRVWEYPIKEQYGHILLAINASNPVADAEEGFRKVNEHENADYAFIHDSAEVKYEITKNCNLTEVGEVFAEQPYSIAIQQGSQLQDELSRTILILQKDRFFELLSGKYWNNSLKAQCSNSDESEGITLESLGGVFIATLFGLALAMVTLAIEVFYYRHRDRRNNMVTDIQSNRHTNKTPPPSYDSNDAKNFRFRGKGEQVTLGDKFVPASQTTQSRLSYISMYPRRPNELLD